MTNRKIGSFIACLRKEQGLTQEQLAEKIGVSNRSISRWENGKTLPDYSLLPVLSAVLNVSKGDLLTGQRVDKNCHTEDCVRLALDLAQHQKDILRKKLNYYFGTGLFFLVCGGLFSPISEAPLILFLLCCGLAAGFFAAGFWVNNRKTTACTNQIKILVKADAQQRIRTAAEMLQFSMKYQTGHKKQHRRAFDALAAALANDEYVQFAFIADNCTFNGSPGPWYIGAAITNKRLLISGEVIRGRFMTAIETASYDRNCLNSLYLKNGKLVLYPHSTSIEIHGHNMAAIAERLHNLCSN